MSDAVKKIAREEAVGVCARVDCGTRVRALTREGMAQILEAAIRGALRAVGKCTHCLHDAHRANACAATFYEGDSTQPSPCRCDAASEPVGASR